MYLESKSCSSFKTLDKLKHFCFLKYKIYIKNVEKYVCAKDLKNIYTYVYRSSNSYEKFYPLSKTPIKWCMKDKGNNNKNTINQITPHPPTPY